MTHQPHRNEEAQDVSDAPLQLDSSPLNNNMSVKISTLVHVAMTLLAVGFMYARDNSQLEVAKQQITELRTEAAVRNERQQALEIIVAGVSAKLDTAINQLSRLESQARDPR